MRLSAEPTFDLCWELGVGRSARCSPAGRGLAMWYLAKSARRPSQCQRVLHGSTAMSVSWCHVFLVDGWTEAMRERHSEVQAEFPTAGAKALVVMATCVVLGVWLLLCLVAFGFSAMCQDDFDGSDCAEAGGAPLLFAGAGVALAALQLVAALRARSRRSAFRRGILVLVLAPLTLVLVMALAWS